MMVAEEELAVASLAQKLAKRDERGSVRLPIAG